VGGGVKKGEVEGGKAGDEERYGASTITKGGLHGGVFKAVRSEKRETSRAFFRGGEAIFSPVKAVSTLERIEPTVKQEG